MSPVGRGDPVPPWQPSRVNARYHAALRLAGLVLRATSVEHAAGTAAVNGFLVDMPALFEDFMTTALREALEACCGGRVEAQARGYLDVAGRVALRPDIVWRTGGSAAAVIDAKYKAEKPVGHPDADSVSGPGWRAESCWSGARRDEGALDEAVRARVSDSCKAPPGTEARSKYLLASPGCMKNVLLM